MLEEHNKRDKSHLINIIKRRIDNTPNFAILIGAGTSATSGIKTAKEMITEWCQQLYKQSLSDKPFEEWLKEQDWFEDDEEYSILFERVYDQASQRRNYIEECVKDARSSWGYIFLANIISHNYFNVVFTPNFDDLLNEACFMYADLRPIVCAHDSAVAGIRVTSARPKVIKLHGDFLYDSMKNTVVETERLEKNMRDKFIQFAGEYGLVVIGYGGNDRSIMDTLDGLLRSEVYFPHGVYWCIREKSKLSKKLQRLMRREKIYWVEIEGFDEFMAELHEELGLTLPDAVRDPYQATTKRLNRFILPKDEVKHPIIKKGINQLEEHVKRFEQLIYREATKEEVDKFVPYRFRGNAEFSNKNYEKAVEYYEKALIQGEKDLLMMQLMTSSYINIEQFDKALEISEKMIKEDPQYFSGYFRKGFSLMFLGRFVEAITSYNKALELVADKSVERATIEGNISNALLITGDLKGALAAAEKALLIYPKDYGIVLNKCIALKRLGKEAEAKQIVTGILPEIQDSYIRACAYATLDDKQNMLNELEVAIKQDTKYRVYAKSDPDFTDYREDPEFRRLVY